MELKRLSGKLVNMLSKYRYAVLVLIIGLVLLLLPGKSDQETTQISEPIPSSQQSIEETALEEILKSIHGAGSVKVLLSIADGEETIYQNNTDISNSGDDSSQQIETVLVTDSQRMQHGLIRQVNPPSYLGAIVVCEGADNAAVKLAITQAVSKITGLSTDHICVLKMK